MKAQSRRTAVLMLIVTFVVGGMTGMAVEEGFGLDWFDFLDKDEITQNAATDEQFLMTIGLDFAQRARIEDIYDAQEEKLETYWKNQLPALKTIVQQTDVEVVSVLTPAQRKLFDDRIKNRGSSVLPPSGD